MSPIEVFSAMIVLHCICDYAWQGEFLASAKNWTTPGWAAEAARWAADAEVARREQFDALTNAIIEVSATP